MDQLPQLIGAGLLLIGYALFQTNRIKGDSVPYLLLNLLGAMLLAYDAIRAMQWGFIILECAWCVFTLRNLYRALVRKPAA